MAQTLSLPDEDPNDTPLVLKADEGLPLERLETFLEDARECEPLLRRMATEDAYYHGKQLTQAQIDLYEGEWRLPRAVQANLIAPAVNVALGMEAQTRSDWIVRPEDGEIDQDMADALSAELHKAEVGSRADRACSDAYAAMMRGGLGWVEVSRETDPFRYPYRAGYVPRREMLWDVRDTVTPDMGNARFIIRRRMVDEDVAVARFPEHARLIEQAVNDFAHWDPVREQDPGLLLAHETQKSFSIDTIHWLNAARRQIMIYEVWYQVMVKGHVLRLPNGRHLEFDLANDDHVMAVHNGFLQPMSRIFRKWRRAWFAGPHRLEDEANPYPFNRPCYIPFIGFREESGEMYGLVKPMISPQDEVNARKNKALWLLNATRVIADDDAVEDHDAAAEEVGAANAYLVLNSKRRPDSRFEVIDGGNLAAQQFQAMEAAKQEINQVSGIYQSMIGANSNATSGLAINSLVQQGVTTLAEINDNNLTARRLVGECLAELVMEDLEKKIGHPVTIREGMPEEKVVTLNEPTVTEDGIPTLLNNVAAAWVSVIIDDTPSSATYRLQVAQQVTELTKSLPEDVQRAVFDLVVEAYDLPKKREFLTRIRGALGVGADGQMPNPEVVQLQQMVEQVQTALQATQEEGQKHIEELEQQVAQLQLQLKNKAGELALRSREVDARIGLDERRLELEETKLVNGAIDRQEDRADLTRRQAAEGVQ